MTAENNPVPEALFAALPERLRRTLSGWSRACKLRGGRMSAQNPVTVVNGV
jgi:hypothetical protein